jgi:NAD-dependent DNA ligase
MHTTLTAEDLTAITGIGDTRAREVLAAISQALNSSREDELANWVRTAGIRGLNERMARHVAKMVFERKRSEETEDAAAMRDLLTRDTDEAEDAALERALGRRGRQISEALQTGPSSDTAFKVGLVNWEEFYGLPAGCVEAIEKQPARARIAQVLAQVRDLALMEHGITPTFGGSNGS